MALFEKLDSGTLGDAVLRLLQKRIISGELKAGEWLAPERELAEQMGISRGSLHQAILALEYQGFVSIIPRKGTVVCDYRKHPTAQSLTAIMSYGSTEMEQNIFGDMMNFRIWMEAECARLACSNIYESTLAEMEELAGSFLLPDADHSDILYRFHYHLTQASGNSIFSMIFRGFEPAVRNLTEKSYKATGADVKTAAELMKKLTDSIRAKDEAAAVDTVRTLLGLGIDRLRSEYKE